MEEWKGKKVFPYINYFAPSFCTLVVIVVVYRRVEEWKNGKEKKSFPI
jgi:hypothetical protein